MSMLVLLILAVLIVFAPGRAIDDGLTIEARSRRFFAGLGRSRRWGDEPLDRI